MRFDAREADALRPVRMTPNFIPSADGSVLIEWGNTRVICTVLLENSVPEFKKGTGEGWLTAEYAMLPASTGKRKQRETLKPDGRSTEIKRLIGRAIRACVDMTALGEATAWIDCDVIQADGGTRTASITGAYVALALAAKKWLKDGRVERNPVVRQLAAVSAGMIDGECVLDLCYAEDSRAEVDMNFVMTAREEFVEIQGTGEHAVFTRKELNTLLDLAAKGCHELMTLQNEVIEQA